MTDITYRHPTIMDSENIWNLIRNNKPLDENSLYLYTLLCHEFSDTCVVAESDSKIIGFLSAFIPPKKPETLFVWQIAVDKEFRNKGVAQKIISYSLNNIGDEIKFIEATVTPSNLTSLKFFQTLADNNNTKLIKQKLFSTEILGGVHEPEDLVRIGPLIKREKEVVV